MFLHDLLAQFEKMTAPYIQGVSDVHSGIYTLCLKIYNLHNRAWLPDAHHQQHHVSAAAVVYRFQQQHAAALLLCLLHECHGHDS